MPEIFDAREAPQLGHLYAIPPIDWWNGWTLFSNAQWAKDETDTNYSMEEVTRFLWAAKRAARSVGWEGDMTVGPFVSGLPLDGDPSSGIMLAWKQSDNGTTYVASPVALPWLKVTGSSQYVHFQY